MSSSGVDSKVGRVPARKGIDRRQASLLRRRHKKGTFARGPRRDLEVVLICGSVRGIDRLFSENIRAVRTGVERGILAAMIEMIPRTAKRKGKMRAVLQVTAQQIAREKTTVLGSTITVDLDDVREIASAIAEYIRYHMDPGSDFPKGYKEPFTEGTAPFNLLELQAKTIFNVTNEMRASQRAAGLAIR